MIETLEAIATQLLFIVFPGLVLHRAVATRVLALDHASSAAGEIPETDLVVYGLLPGLAISNTVGTALAIFGQFRTAVFVAMMSALVLWRWRDAVATLRTIAQQGRIVARSVARGEVMVVIATVIFLQSAFALFINAQIPSGNVDVWHHNLPLAQSIVSHRGFVLPQIPGMFYGTYPIFFHMFFAEGLLFVDHVIAAKAINSLIYLSFLLSLLFCAKRGRPVMALVLLFVIIGNPYFSNGAEDGMTDVPRVCFSVLALAFTYRYLRDGRLYFIFAAGLLAGGAIAGKYTELLTPALIGLSLLPGLFTRLKDGWIAICVLAAAFLPVAGYPYLRNLILLHNPIYPFIFSHPGMSDQEMRALNFETFHTFDAAYRNYSMNFLSWQGWHDFFKATSEIFVTRWYVYYGCLVATGACLIFLRSRIIFPVIWSFLLAISWYTVGNINARWGLTAYMMMLTTGFLSIAWLLDGLIAKWMPDPESSTGAISINMGLDWIVAFPSWLTPKRLMRLSIAALLAMICLVEARAFGIDGWSAVLPAWTNKPQARAVITESVDGYLARTRPGFEIYRYIGDHDLRTVLQPLDNGATLYQAAYNGGRNGDWLLPWYMIPGDPGDFDNFLRQNNVKYFVYRDSVEPIVIERLGQASGNPKHVEMAYALYRYMLPNSRRILVDPFGWELYAVGDKAIR